MSKAQQSQTEWNQKKNEAHQTKRSSERVDELRRSKLLNGGGEVHSRSITEKAFQKSLNYNACFIAREFHHEGIGIDTIIEYLSNWQRGLNPVKEDILYHIENHCTCEGKYDHHFYDWERSGHLSVCECSMIRRGDVELDYTNVSKSAFTKHKYGRCSHGNILEPPMGKNENDNEGEQTNEKTDLEKLVDGEIDEIENVYVEDDGE